MEYLIGAGVMWVILAGLFTWYQETYKEFLEIIVALPIVIFVWILAILQFPFACFWKFIRNAIRGVSEDAWNKANLKHFKRFGNICFVYDKRARAFQNKFFMVRLVPNDNKEIIHTPTIIYSDISSSPEGEFRIGEDD